MTDSPHMLVSGGGSTAVNTDAMLADAQNLRRLHRQLPPVASSLRAAAALAGPAEAAALGSWRAQQATVSLGSAAMSLDTAIDECARIASALERAGENYARVEREATERFVAAIEGVAAVGGRVVGGIGRRSELLSTLLIALAAAHGRLFLDEPIHPADIVLPSGVNAFLSDPAVVRTLRALVMSGDDFVDGVVGVQPGEHGVGREVGFSALVLTALGSMAGLFSGAAVTTAAYGPLHRSTAPRSIADRAARIPSAVDGDVPQVRIDTYSQPGLPDRFEVYVGGTVDFSPVAKGEPFDLTSNLELEAGLPAGAYEGVREAMALAGITADSEVVITGHSQGGLIAARLAESGDYSVTGLVTFGAPAGQVVIPASVPSLLIEHDDDIVPALGGVQLNEDALLVRARAYPHDLPAVALPAHRIEAYQQTAAAIDTGARSDNLVAFRDGLSSFGDGYTTVSSQLYLVTRDEVDNVSGGASRS